MSQEDEASIPIEEEEDLAPLSLTDEEETSGRSPTRIQAFGAHTAVAGMEGHEYKRTPNLTGAGAIRCRLFHSKITVAALDHMVNTINEWLDADEIEVKYISQVIGTMEGKKPEPNVIITVWY